MKLEHVEGHRQLLMNMFLCRLHKLAVCQRGCEPDERASLQLWEQRLSETDPSFEEESRFEPRLTRWVLSYQYVKEQIVRNPDNLCALLIYKISHTEEIEVDKVAFGKESNCFRKDCGTVDHAKRHIFLEKTGRGLRLAQLKKPVDCIQLITGTHLNEHQISQLIGHKINLSRIEKQVQDRFDILASDDGKGLLPNGD